MKYEGGAMAGGLDYEERKRSFIKSASLVLRYGLYGGQDGPATTMYFLSPSGDLGISLV